MAPEVLRKEPYDNKADLYSLGNVYYQMLFGTVPFSANNIPSLIEK
jgi:serine/threonine protein kinase